MLWLLVVGHANGPDPTFLAPSRFFGAAGPGPSPRHSAGCCLNTSYASLVKLLVCPGLGAKRAECAAGARHRGLCRGRGQRGNLLGYPGEILVSRKDADGAQPWRKAGGQGQAPAGGSTLSPYLHFYWPNAKHLALLHLRKGLATS